VVDDIIAVLALVSAVLLLRFRLNSAWLVKEALLYEA
jgi:hypothetical protein